MILTYNAVVAALIEYICCEWWPFAKTTTGVPNSSIYLGTIVRAVMRATEKHISFMIILFYVVNITTNSTDIQVWG